MQTNIELRKPAAFLCLIIYLAVPSLILFYSPDKAASLRPTDATEYAVSAYRLAVQGSFDIVLGEKVHPTRYQPGFGVLFLTPVYLINADNIGLGILSVLFSALIILLALWRLCGNMLPDKRRLIAAFLLMATMIHITVFYNLSRTIMSDIPTLMLGCLALLAFQSAWQRPRMTVFLAGGLATAAAFTIRMPALSYCLPFVILLLRSYRHTPFKPLLSWALALVLPITV